MGAERHFAVGPCGRATRVGNHQLDVVIVKYRGITLLDSERLGQRHAILQPHLGAAGERHTVHVDLQAVGVGAILYKQYHRRHFLMRLALVGEHDLHLRLLAGGNVNKVAHGHRNLGIVELHGRIVKRQPRTIVLGLGLTLVGAARLAATCAKDGPPVAGRLVNVHSVGVAALRVVERVGEPLVGRGLVNVVLGLVVADVSVGDDDGAHRVVQEAVLAPVGKAGRELLHRVVHLLGRGAGGVGHGHAALKRLVANLVLRVAECLDLVLLIVGKRLLPRRDDLVAPSHAVAALISIRETCPVTRAVKAVLGIGTPH